MKTLTDPFRQAALIRAAVLLVPTAVLTCGLISPVQAESHRYDIDPEHFSIGFMIGHAGYEQVLGMFLEGRGQFVYDEATRTLSSGTIIIQSESVFTNHDKRDDHVKGDDFLDADEHDSIVFKAGMLKTVDGKKGTLAGDLTMLGQTHPVELDVTLNKAADYPFGHKTFTLGISARTTLQRSQWGMDYGVDKNLVADDVDLVFEFEAIRQ